MPAEAEVTGRRPGSRMACLTVLLLQLPLFLPQLRLTCYRACRRIGLCLSRVLKPRMGEASPCLRDQCSSGVRDLGWPSPSLAQSGSFQGPRDRGLSKSQFQRLFNYRLGCVRLLCLPRSLVSLPVPHPFQRRRARSSRGPTAPPCGPSSFPNCILIQGSARLWGPSHARLGFYASITEWSNFCRLFGLHARNIY